ncbi:Stk1 family PASTA domain-containing Ser/Thr kinase [Lapillicoccus jejuensis]|uniref:non-specific serine/threonine protein kinase n=1 Tax=Lapillicoccus jejuensis TaxID=402171 RepID=A0A542E5R4_9MICO|nr:Stk1 family PASTA domain-containing Ser/Thr kinase [Lapillicoccus jejuensis]TQJ10626.1 serine/threonine-protein kinase [Lapillicoccus jejuensis]
MSTGTWPGVQPVVGRLLDGRYRVLEHLADGGMASVWLAVDERLDREVAVKLPRRDLVSDPTFASRFRREARSAARLGHPHVVSVHDQGEDDGDLFLVMEYVPGRTLRELVTAEGPLPARRALDLLDGLLQALDAAHATGLIHRDVKPENVLIRPDGLVKVADFGLARAVTAATTTNASGTLMGTVAYLSPEQVERGIADARSDVYAAGLVLFELLTGRKAFEGDSPISIAYQHVHGSVPAPSSLVPSVPAELDALVALGTARDPDQRPTGAGDYLVELRRVRRDLGTAELDVRPVRRALAAPTTAVPTARPTTDQGGATGPVGHPTTRLPRTGHDGDTDAMTPYGDPAHPGEHPGGRPARRRWPAVAALLALLVAAGGGAGWWFTLGPGGMTQVPRVATLDQGAATAALASADLGVTTEETFSETVAAGTVVASVPAVGAEVHKHSSVRLVVSRGTERYGAPGLVGTAASAAQGTLEAGHLRLGAVTQTWSETVAAGTIVSQDPPPGGQLKPGTPVAVVVSQGRQPIQVADWTGKPADDATSALTQAGIKVVTGTAVNSDTVAQGSVVSQTPGASTLHKGDTVTIVVSKGPVMVAVPQVVGKQRDEATQLLKAAGFQVAYQEILGGFFGTVRGSDPGAGTMVRKGSTVTLTIV